jgi:hypothetical protein
MAKIVTSANQARRAAALGCYAKFVELMPSDRYGSKPVQPIEFWP